MALGLAQVSGISSSFHLVCVCISAACVAGLGYHAADQTPRPPGPPIVLFAVLLGALTLALCGCKVGGLGFDLKCPAFGSVGVSLDGGVIGKGHVRTNAPTPVPGP